MVKKYAKVLVLLVHSNKIASTFEPSTNKTIYHNNSTKALFITCTKVCWYMQTDFFFKLKTTKNEKTNSGGTKKQVQELGS